MRQLLAYSTSQWESGGDSMKKRLRQTGIEAIGDVPWGTHCSQFYEKKEDLLEILVPYFKKGLENNELCVWVTSPTLDNKLAEEALRREIIDLDHYIKIGQLRIITYKEFYLKYGAFNIEIMIDEWRRLKEVIDGSGFEGLRICGDESWLPEENYMDFNKYERQINKIAEDYNVLIICLYPIYKCSASNVLDIINSHHATLIRKDNEWQLIESSNLKKTRATLNKVHRFYSVLSRVNHAIIRIQEIDKLFEEVCRVVVEYGLFNVAWIGLINEEDPSKLDPVAQWGLKNGGLDAIRDLLAKSNEVKEIMPVIKTVRQGKYAVFHDLNQYYIDSSLYKELIIKGIKSFAVFPIKLEGKIVGFINFSSIENITLGREEIELLESLTDDLSYAAMSIIKENQRKQTEEELRDSEERYRRIVELSPDAIYAYKDGIFKFSNIMGAKIFGFDRPEDMIGASLLEYIHEDYKDIVKERMQSVQRKGIILPFAEEKIVQKSGHIVEIEVTATLCPVKGEDVTLVVARDITERKRLELMKKMAGENIRLLREAREYDKLKTEFFANISHELRTPINVILSAIQLINLYIDRGQFQVNMSKLTGYTYTVQQNCYRLLRLVNNLIDITKIDSGYYELKLENHNIVNIVEDITLSVVEYVENKGINLIFDTDIEERIIACDPDKIERIILNLLSNAVKFTNPGGEIMVYMYEARKNIYISVKDTGIGIPEDKLKIVFERFRQVDKSLTRKTEGSGIGLSLVMSLVKLHGGNIYLKSEYGKGSEFIIELPIRILDSEEKTNLCESVEQNIERINIEFSDIYS